MVQYGIKLSTKHPSEINNNFETFLFKINPFKNKIRFFHNIPIKIKIFRNEKKCWS